MHENRFIAKKTNIYHHEYTVIDTPTKVQLTCLLRVCGTVCYEYLIISCLVLGPDLFDGGRSGVLPIHQNCMEPDCRYHTVMKRQLF